MKETPKSDSRSTVGVVPGAAHLALDVADRSQSTAIAVLQDARVEIKAVVDHAIEFAEKTSASFFRFAKKLGQRLDEGVADTLGKTERLLTGAVDSARTATKAATELAHTATTSLAGAPTAQA
ncbi:MAG TPA: hypothetical protein VGC41_13760 [Kofleriaceae bacterium]